MKYTIISMGYDGGPEFTTKAEGHIELMKMVRASVKECRNRTGHSCVVKMGEDNYAVHVGNKKSATVWATFTLVGLD
jgi:hypothetical protein